MLRQERSRLGADLERLGWPALGGQLEDHGVVRIEPELADDLSVVSLGRELQLEHEDRAEYGEVVQAESVRRMGRVQGALFLREELPNRSSRRHDVPDGPRSQHALHRARADVAARHGVDLDAEVARVAELSRKLVGNDRTQLHHRVVSFALDPASAEDKATFV